MFSRKPDASKVALVFLAQYAMKHGIELIDCQLPTEHLSSMGAVNISRSKYMELLEKALRHKDRTRHWELET
jgi:leucyl/phenylalanyl-tRNA--protein transferase